MHALTRSRRTNRFAIGSSSQPSLAAQAGRFSTSCHVTTSQELPGQAVLKRFGVVRGLTVRSRSVVGRFFAGIQTIFGGDISVYRELCGQARRDAFDQICRQADGLGANAIIGVRYDATEVMAGVNEVLCYGTAVRVSDPPSLPG